MVDGVDSDWPEDPTDPRCPACGEPVSATASYCMHCEADLPGTESRPVAATTTSERAPTTVDPAGDTAGSESADSGTPTDASDWRSRWLHPDSAIDDVSTAAVGVVGGVLDEILLLALSVWALPDGEESMGPLVVAFVGWIVATGWIAWTRTVFGAIRKAAYSLGGLLALVPLLAAYALGDADVLVLGVVVWPLAAIVAGVGWLAGRGAVDDGG